ncbi:MAG: response regulator [Burkholderiales bacterium]|nr:response regulator [Burkholderiales bacterium]
MDAAVAREERIAAEQVRTLYAQLPVSVPTQIVGGAILAVAMWGPVSGALLAAWFCVHCANQLVRILFYRRWRRRRRPDNAVARWRALWVAGAALTGIVWGSAGVLMFVPGSPAHQAVLIVALLGIATGSITVIATNVAAFYTFASAVVAPVLARTAWEGGESDLVLAAIGCVVLAAILASGRNLSMALARSLAMYHQNLDLIEALEAQRAIAERARREAEAATRDKTRFFAAASHDLRQPLHAMGLFAAALAEKVREPEVRGVVASIHASVQALEALFNELLDIAKIDSGAVQPVVRAFALAPMFDRLEAEFAPVAAGKGLTLAVEAGETVVASDAVLVERIVRNLLGNALRYTREGGVRLAAAPAGGAVRIEVRDSGTGIPAQDRGRIFDEFVQLENPARTSGKGMGLGLSIVKRLTALLGCGIGVDSEPGRGSTFSFELPRGALAPEQPVPAAAPAPPGLAGLAAVVIDDEAAILESMRALLSGWGMDVIASATGEDVVGAVHARGRMPDIIIADYRLGGGATGIEVTERLRRELDPEIPAILVTGSTAPELAQEARRGRCELLLKPVRAEKLRELIDAALR